MRAFAFIFVGSLVMCGQTSLGVLPQSGQGASSSSDQFSADRPGFAISADVLPLGIMQIESGFTSATSGGYGQSHRTFIMGSPLVRLGVGNRIELRVGEDGFVNTSWITNDGVHSHGSGWSDITLGAKVSVLRQRRLVPALSILSGTSLPTGAQAVGSGSYNPSLSITMSENLPAQFSLGATYTLWSKVDGGSRQVDRTMAISAGRSIRKGLAGYAEVYLDELGSASSGPLWMYDGGFSQTIHGRVQVDVEAGNQFSGAGKSSFIAAGIVYRYHVGLHGALTQLWAR